MSRTATGGAAHGAVDSVVSTAPPDGRTRRMLNDAPLSLLMRMASPNALAFLVQATVSMTEVWFVGQLGTTALAAMALVFPGLMLMQMLANGAFGGAVTSAIARALGAGRLEQAERLIWHAVAIALGVAGCFFLSAWFWLRPMLAAVSPDPHVVEQATTYGLILFGGCPLLWTMALLSSVYRGMGNMKFPALLMVVSATIQIPLSGALIFGWFGLPRLGISGAAVSVISVALLNSLILVARLRHVDSPLKLRMDRLVLAGPLFAAILRIGLPSALSPILTVATISGVNVLVGEFGVAALAGYGIASRVEFLLIPMVFGLGVSMTALVGVNLGAGQLSRAVRIGWTGGVCASLLTGLVGAALALFPTAWAGMFTDDPKTLASAVRYLELAGPFFAFQGLGLSLYFASQGAGTVVWPVIATFVRFACAVGIAGVGLRLLDLELDFIYLSTGIGMLLYGVITAASLKYGVWDRANRP